MLMLMLLLLLPVSMLVWMLILMFSLIDRCWSWRWWINCWSNLKNHCLGHVFGNISLGTNIKYKGVVFFYINRITIDSHRSSHSVNNNFEDFRFLFHGYNTSVFSSCLTSPFPWSSDDGLTPLTCLLSPCSLSLWLNNRSPAMLYLYLFFFVFVYLYLWLYFCICVFVFVFDMPPISLLSLWLYNLSPAMLYLFFFCICICAFICAFVYLHLYMTCPLSSCSLFLAL